MARKRVKQPQLVRTEAGQEAVAVRSTGAAAQHTWRNIRLIVRREYTSRVRQRSLTVSTIILLVVIAIAGFAPTIVASTWGCMSPIRPWSGRCRTSRSLRPR